MRKVNGKKLIRFGKKLAKTTTTVAKRTAPKVKRVTQRTARGISKGAKATSKFAGELQKEYKRGKRKTYTKRKPITDFRSGKAKFVGKHKPTKRSLTRTVKMNGITVKISKKK